MTTYFPYSAVIAKTSEKRNRHAYFSGWNVSGAEKPNRIASKAAISEIYY